MPIEFSTTKKLPEIVGLLEELKYKLTSDGDIKKENGLYSKVSIYTRERDDGKDEIKIRQKYSDEEGIKHLIPLSEILLEYEGSLPGLGELQEKKLDSQNKEGHEDSM